MRSRSLVGCFVVLFLVLAVTAPHSSAQAVFGNVLGTVTDAQGNAITGAKITVTSIGKNTSYDTTSNESGNYTVTHLIPDEYKVHVEAAGFKAYDVASIMVTADTSIKVDAQLQVGEITQTVEVTGAVPQLETDRSDVDIQFNQQYVTELPILDRNFTNFELLSPGTQKLPGFNHAATENPQGGGQIQVNGQHFSGTNFELDGTDNQDPILGIIVVNPNLDAISETKIALQDFDAETGKATSGVVKVSIKSGSNELHGSGFYFYRNSDQEARDPFTNKPGVPLAAATWKQYGGAVGGPIIKDKLFFFGDYQGTHQIQGITNQYTIPTTEVIQTCNPATNAASPTPNFCDLSQYINAYGSNGSGAIFNPTTGNNATGSGRTQFCGPLGCAAQPNYIPIGMIPAGIGMILADFGKLTPNVTCPTGILTTQQAACLTQPNYDAQGSGPYNQNSFDIRIDYSAPHNYQVFGRFSLDYFNLSGTGGLGVLGGAGFGPGGLNGTSTVHNYSVAGGFTKPLGTKWLTDFRIGWFEYNPVTAYSDANQQVDNSFGFPGLNLGTPDTGGTSGFQFCQNGSCGSAALGGGNGALSAFGDGLNIGRCNCPLTERERQIQFVNNWTYTWGNHTIKFGGDIRYATNLRVPSDSSRTGILSFDQLGTGDNGAFGLGLATFLLGDVSQFDRFVSTTNDAVGHQWRTFYYGQDTWRVSSKFTFTYGVRWEIYFPEAVTAKGNAGFADLQDGVLKVAGFGGVSDSGNVQNTLKAFAPRLSFAYQFDPKTVVRIGYGRSFDIGVFGSNFGHAVTQNLPVLANQVIQDSNLNTANVNNRSAVFNLTAGPTAYPFASVISDISPQGTLPLLGPDGTAGTYIRPTIQRLPTVDEWNATIQRQVTPTLNITASYVGNKGTHVFAGTGPSYNINDVAVGSGTNLLTCSVTVVPPATCPVGDVVPGGFNPSIPQNNRREFFLNGVPAFTYPNSFFLNAAGVMTPTPPCCAVTVGNYFGNDASNKYNALQIKAEKRVSHGLQFLAHYTFSHAFAYDSNYYDVNKKYAWGPNPFNRNNAFVISTIYDLPIGKGKAFMGDIGRKADLLIGGWQITNTLNWSSGLPWTPGINGSECNEVTDAGPCRPNVIGTERLKTGITHINGGTYYFTPLPALSYSGLTAADIGTDSCTLARPTTGPFSLPNCGQIGNLGFDTYWGPRAFFDDLALSKTFAITERIKALFRFDAYNVFNHPVLGISNAFNSCVDCGASSGQITDIEADSAPGSPVGMRQLQFGFRVIF